MSLRQKALCDFRRIILKATGHRYGTILCNLEQGRFVDLLPNRNTETVTAWLRRHPSIQVVSRDRASAFADAISKGAPKAKQVADRWHLLNNLIDTLGRSLERHRHTLHAVAEGTARRSRKQTMESVEPKRLTKALACKQQNRERRLARHRELVKLLDGGINRSEASRHMGLQLRTRSEILRQAGLSGLQGAIAGPWQR